MEQINIKPFIRKSTGKSYAKKLRAKGFVPAICYRQGKENLMLELAYSDIDKILRSTMKLNSIINLDLSEYDLPQKRVIIKGTQHHPLVDNMLHLDFLEIEKNEKIKIKLPLILNGKPEGVKMGGILQQTRRSIMIEALPENIHPNIQVDISEMELGDTMHVSDLTLPDGIIPIYTGDYSIASIIAPDVEEEEVEVEEEETEVEVEEEEATEE